MCDRSCTEFISGHILHAWVITVRSMAPSIIIPFLWYYPDLISAGYWWIVQLWCVSVGTITITSLCVVRLCRVSAPSHSNWALLVPSSGVHARMMIAAHGMAGANLRAVRYARNWMATCQVLDRITTVTLLPHWIPDSPAISSAALPSH